MKINKKNKLQELLDILASEIANPAKWKWIFNSVFITRTVNFFKFIRRKGETITIEIVEQNCVRKYSDMQLLAYSNRFFNRIKN